MFRHVNFLAFFSIFYILSKAKYLDFKSSFVKFIVKCTIGMPD